MWRLWSNWWRKIEWIGGEEVWQNKIKRWVKGGREGEGIGG
jgi:hypothetical protein